MGRHLPEPVHSISLDPKPPQVPVSYREFKITLTFTPLVDGLDLFVLAAAPYCFLHRKAQTERIEGGHTDPPQISMRDLRSGSHNPALEIERHIYRSRRRTPLPATARRDELGRLRKQQARLGHPE
jgi:hypothetical protein